MIQEYKTVDVEQLKRAVSLGNLGLNNACSYYVPKDPKEYPMARFGKRTAEGNSFNIFTDKPEDCPADHEIYEQYDNPTERLLEYAFELMSEHSDLTNEQINHDPEFHGRKRSARWQDERRRRGLIK